MVVTLFSFGQVFDRGDWPGPALLGMALSMLVVVGARRLGLGGGLTFIAAAVALLWYVTVIFRMDDLFYGLPTPAALEGVWHSIDVAYGKSAIDYAPVPVRTGYVIGTVFAMWVATAVGEVATFRWKRPLLATLPAIALFSLVSIVGTGESTTFIVLLFLAALLAYLALEASRRLQAWGSWITSLSVRDRETPGEVSSRLARRMGASCLAAALFSPLFLPAIGDGLLSWRSGSGVGPGSGSGAAGGAIDLLASLQPRLLEQSETEMFRVVSEASDYWRLTSLVLFDGTTWRPLGGNEEVPIPVSQGLIPSAHSPESFRSVRQRFTIAGLEGQLMPAAVEPAAVEILDDTADPVDLRYRFETASIELQSGISENVGYEVTSRVSRPSFNELRQATVPLMGPEDQEPSLAPIYYATGPVPISDEVRQLAQGWTEDFDTPFLKLSALQDNLRLFTYSIDVPPTASTDHLTTFLIDERRGYCQQFAAAFALLARHLGFPARVSVGFLPGETDIATPTDFLVKGTDAHAWPEVFFDDYGWVRFEPTPGNGASPPGYTSRPTAASQSPTISDTRRLNAGPGSLEGNVPVPVGGRDRGGEVDPADPRAPEGRPAWAETFARLLSTLVVGILILIALVPVTKTVRTAVRYRRARTPIDQVAAAFAHFESEATELAGARGPSESATAYARRMGDGYHVPREAALQLATIYERAIYGPREVEATTAHTAKNLAGDLRGPLWSGATWLQRAQRLFSPKGLLFSR
jgi:transglutaminase-like putative cysteine protease